METECLSVGVGRTKRKVSEVMLDFNFSITKFSSINQWRDYFR